MHYVLKVPVPASVTILTNPPHPIILGSDVTLICMVEMSEKVLSSDLPLLMVDAQLSRPDGTPLALTGSPADGTTFTYTTQLNSFGRNDSGNYTCTATVNSNSSHLELIENASLISKSINVSISEFQNYSYSHNCGLLHSPVEEMAQIPTGPASRVGIAIGVVFLLLVLLISASVLVVAVGLRKILKTNLKFKKPGRSRSEHLEDHDYITHSIAPHQYDKSEGESLELKENDETQAEKDKDYYFMDTTLIGEFIKLY